MYQKQSLFPQSQQSQQSQQAGLAATVPTAASVTTVTATPAISKGSPRKCGYCGLNIYDFQSDRIVLDNMVFCDNKCLDAMATDLKKQHLRMEAITHRFVRI